MVALQVFSRNEVTPRSFERLECRLARLGRELARLLLQQTVNRVESPERPGPMVWEHRKFRPNRRTFRTMETGLGTIQYQRWFFQAEFSFFVKGIAPLDQRLGLVGDRVSPGVAHKLGRLAADLPQQPALEQLREQFNVSLSVDAYRRVVEHLSDEVRFLHDDAAIEQLLQWIEQATKTAGNHDILLLVGRDGVHVPMRHCWKEAACATISIYDRNRKRLGTVYLGQMPQKNQVSMTGRLTGVIEGTLKGAPSQTLRLRYVTDAGGLPRSYFRKVLSKMKHPVTGDRLKWSWGVDYYHACQYVSQLSDALFGAGTQESQAWFKVQRHTLGHDKHGAKKIITRAAQQKRRHGLQGSHADYDGAKGYLVRYRPYMDYARRRLEGDPIGSGVTEAGCKVIFNQRFKQSGMRWSKQGGQTIVDLRTACRSGLWQRIWTRWLASHTLLPEIKQVIPFPNLAAA